MILRTLTILFIPKVRYAFIDKLVSTVTDIPIIGDLLSAGVGHASAKNLQNDAQAHDTSMFIHQAAHDKDMFGLESEFSAKQAELAYQRQRNLLKDSPGLQMQGLKAAGLNPILAATGGFKTPAGGSLPIARATAGSSAKGSGQGSPPGVKVQLGQARLLNAQADLAIEQKKNVGQNIDIKELAKEVTDRLMDVLERMPWIGSETSSALKKYKKAQSIRSDVIEVTPHVEKMIKKKLKNKPRGRGALKKRGRN
jgi:hypothetical protein